jgi:glycosyltransferase involved in cell wall biosynthesis
MIRKAAIVIITKNRKDELRKAIQSSLTQNIPVEVVVVDDGSTDGTAEMVRAEFPQVIFHRDETSHGYILQRNRGAEMASAPIIFSIDDDAVFASPHTVEQTLAEFDDSRIGAAAIPYIDVLYGPTVHQRDEYDGGTHITAVYRGTAHALRREVFLSLGGYRPFIVHQGEEQDFSIRLFDAGYVIRLGRADPIHHYESPKRSTSRILYYHARSHILRHWWNVPMPWMPVHIAWASVNLLKAHLRRGQFWPTLRGLAAGFGGIVRQFNQRRPVSRHTYRLRCQLVRRKTMSLDEIAPLLPPMKTIPPASPAEPLGTGGR